MSEHQERQLTGEGWKLTLDSGPHRANFTLMLETGEVFVVSGRGAFVLAPGLDAPVGLGELAGD